MTVIHCTFCCWFFFKEELANLDFVRYCGTAENSTLAGYVFALRFLTAVIKSLPHKGMNKFARIPPKGLGCRSWKAFKTV